MGGTTSRQLAPAPETPSRAAPKRSDEPGLLDATHAPRHQLGSRGSSLLLQPKLRVGAHDDPTEREADRVADAVTRPVAVVEPVVPSITSVPVLRRCGCEGPCTCEKDGAKDEEDAEPAESLVQPKQRAGAPATPPDDVESRIDASRGRGAALPPEAREHMESRFGFDFSRVRVHTDAASHALNRDLDALAFTVGADIYFGPGQFQPATRTGQRLLAHELTHVVQQGPAGHTAAPRVISRQQATGTDADLRALGIDPRSFAELWSEFDRIRATGDDEAAFRLAPSVVAHMSGQDAIDHAGDIALWLIHHDHRDQAVQALEQLEASWWVRFATGDRMGAPLWISGGLGLPPGPEELVAEGEHEAAAGHHDTARKLLGVAHLMSQMMLSRLYAERARTAEAAAAFGEEAAMFTAISDITEGGEVERLTALRTRILNVYPNLAAEQRRAGNLVSASAVASEGQTLAHELGDRYTLADLPAATNVAVGTPARTGGPPRSTGGSGSRTATRPTPTPATTSDTGTATPTPAPPTFGADRVVEGHPPFDGATVLALHGNHYVSVSSERYAVSEVLTRATAWAQNLFGVMSSIVVGHGDDDGVVRYYAAALDENLTETFPAANPLEAISVDVAVRIDHLPHDYSIMVVHVGHGVGFWPSRAHNAAYESIVARERRLPAEATHLEPSLVRANVFSQIDALMANESDNLEEIARLLSQLDATAFATLSSDDRFRYLSVLLRAWTLQAQERAVVEIMRSVTGRVELDAIIARLQQAGLWSSLINDLDHELWSLLMTVGERFGVETLTVANVYQIMADNGLLQIGTPFPGLSVGPNGPEFSVDVLAEIEEAANGFLRFVEGMWDAIVMLITHPDKIVEGLGQLTKMVLVFQLADLGYPPAMTMRDQIFTQFGRQLVNGFKGMAVLGVGREIQRRIKWAIIWEVASFFIGVGEIRAAMEAVGVSARVGAIARFLRLLGLVGRVAEVEETTTAITRLARILSTTGRALRTEEEVLVGLSHLPDAEVGRLGRLLEGIELNEGMTLAQLRTLHPELAGAAEEALRRAEIVHQLAAKAGGFSDEVARVFARLSGAGHGSEDLARIVSHIPQGEGGRFFRTLSMIADDAALAGPRGAATLEVLAQSTRRMEAVERFGFQAIDAIMAHTGRDAATLDRYLDALAAIERELPEASRATAMQQLVEAIGRGDTDAIARLDAKVAQLSAPTAARVAQHAIPEWQADYVRDLLEELEERGLLHDPPATAEAHMRANLQGKTDDEVVHIFNEWERQIEAGQDIAQSSLHPPGSGHVDVPTQDLPVTPRERQLAPAQPGVRVASPRRVEVGPADIQAFRTAHPTLAATRDTVAVARTDVEALEGLTLEGASPRVAAEAGHPPQAVGPIESPSGLAQARFHAEQDIANQFVLQVERRGLRPADLEGRTLAIHISNPRGVCHVCRSGFGDPDSLPGVLRQLSERYPGLTIRVTVDGPEGAEIGYRALIINSGELLFQL